LDREGVVRRYRVPCEAVARRDEALHNEEIHVSFGDRQCGIYIYTYTTSDKK
jgi:hypothetical protein